MNHGFDQRQRRRAEELLNLPENWDSYGGLRISPKATEAAIAWMNSWSMVPSVDGAVQMEVHAHGVDFEIVFDPEGKVESYLLCWERPKGLEVQA